MVPLPDFNSWLVPKRPATGLRLGYYNVTLGTIQILNLQCVVRCKRYLDALNGLATAKRRLKTVDAAPDFEAGMAIGLERPLRQIGDLWAFL